MHRHIDPSGQETSKAGKNSVRPKPLVWFRSNAITETQIGQYILSANNVTDIKTAFQSFREKM